MAYNTRFTCNFADLYGMDYKLEIKEDGYSGLSSNILLGAGGFRLTYSGNNRGVGSLIMGSKVDFELQVTNATEKEFIKDLALAGDRDFICTISRDEGAGLYQFWTGFIMSDLVTFQDAPFPFSFNVVASDGFGLAKEIDYTNSVWDAAGKPSDVYRTHAQLLLECFNLIGLSDELTASYPFMIGDTLVKEVSHIDLSNQSKLDVTRLNTKAFALYDTSNEDVAYTYKSVYEVLDEICKTWNARLIQYDGKFWFIPVANYLDTSANFFAMGTNGIFNNTPSNVSLYQTANKYRRLVGGNFDFYPPLAKSCVEYGYYFDPLNAIGEEELDCGISNTEISYKLFDGIEFPDYNDYNGDSTLNILISEYRYKTLWGSQSTPIPTTSNSVMKLEVRSGDYVLTNSISTHNPITFSASEWKRNYEYTFGNFTDGQTVVDISVMDCFGLPSSQDYIKLFLSGVEVDNADFTYSEANKTITLVDPLADSDVLTVIIDNINNGRFYQLGTLTMNTQVLTSSSTDINIVIPPAPSDSGSSYTLKGSFEFYEDSGQFIPLAYTTDFYTDTISSSANYSAQPTSSNKTVKECLENTNDSAENVTIQMFTGDRSEVGSDSNIEIQKTNGDWVKSSEWTISASGLSFTGRLSNCINKTNLHIQETPSLRYNGSVTRVGADLFDVIKGIKIPTFNETDDNLFFGGGSFIASEAIWNIQMIQLGIDN